MLWRTISAAPVALTGRPRRRSGSSRRIGCSRSGTGREPRRPTIMASWARLDSELRRPAPDSRTRCRVRLPRHPAAARTAAEVWRTARLFDEAVRSGLDPLVRLQAAVERRPWGVSRRTQAQVTRAVATQIRVLAFADVRDSLVAAARVHAPLEALQEGRTDRGLHRDRRDTARRAPGWPVRRRLAAARRRRVAGKDCLHKTGWRLSPRRRRSSPLPPRVPRTPRHARPECACGGFGGLPRTHDALVAARAAAGGAVWTGACRPRHRVPECRPLRGSTGCRILRVRRRSS